MVKDIGWSIFILFIFALFYEFSWLGQKTVYTDCKLCRSWLWAEQFYYFTRKEKQVFKDFLTWDIKKQNSNLKISSIVNFVDKLRADILDSELKLNNRGFFLLKILSQKEISSINRTRKIILYLYENNSVDSW